MRTLDIMNEITYANSTMVNTLYKYKHDEETAQIDIANEVCHEYHDGKFDPNGKLYQPKKKKIKRSKRID